MIEHRFRQSWLNTFLACPEQARTTRNGTAIDVAGSKAVRGTAVHAAIETALLARMAGQELTVDTLIEAFHWSWDSLVGTIGKWNKEATTPETTIPMGETMVNVWYQEVFPYLAPVGVEQYFEFVLFEDEARRITLTGTRDLDESDLTWDWKTGQHDREYLIRRNDLQSMIYTLARAHECGDLESPQPFRFCYLANAEVEIIDVTRTPQDWAALVPLCNSIADTIEAKLPSWPLRYDGWKCSDDWCPNWANCRGKYLGVGSKPANW
jgi:hypothetical protein